MRVAVLALAVLAAVAAPASAQEPAPFTVTAADGTVHSATAAELDDWIKLARSTGGHRRDAVDLLVNSAWLSGEAAERGIVVTHEEVVREFRIQRRQSFPSRRAYRRWLRRSGQTTDAVLFRVRIDMLSNRIRAAVTAPVEASVTEADIDAYLAEEGVPGLPERRDVRWVLTARRSTAVTARRELEADRSAPSSATTSFA